MISLNETHSNVDTVYNRDQVQVHGQDNICYSKNCEENSVHNEPHESHCWKKIRVFLQVIKFFNFKLALYVCFENHVNVLSYTLYSYTINTRFDRRCNRSPQRLQDRRGDVLFF